MSTKLVLPSLRPILKEKKKKERVVQKTLIMKKEVSDSRFYINVYINIRSSKCNSFSSSVTFSKNLVVVLKVRDGVLGTIGKEVLKRRWKHVCRLQDQTSSSSPV